MGEETIVHAWSRSRVLLVPGVWSAFCCTVLFVPGPTQTLAFQPVIMLALIFAGAILGGTLGFADQTKIFLMRRLGLAQLAAAVATGCATGLLIARAIG